MIGRAIIKLVDDTQAAQRVQLDMLEGEDPDSVERFGEYGLASYPPDDTDAIGVAVGGDRSHVVCIATNHRESRPKNLAKGEVALFTKQHGKRVYAKENGELHLAAGDEVLSDDQKAAVAKLVMDGFSAVETWVKTGSAPSGGGTVTYSTPLVVTNVACTKVKIK